MHRFLIIACVNLYWLVDLATINKFTVNNNNNNNNDTLKKSYIPFNEIKQGLQKKKIHFSCSTFQRMQQSKNMFFSSSFQLVSLFYSIKPHTHYFYTKKQPLTGIVFQLGIGIVIFDKLLRRVFVDVKLTKILFQLGIIGIERVFLCEKIY